MTMSNYHGIAKVQGTEPSLNKGNVQIFQNNEFGQVRTTLDENGEPLFCLSDLCQVLELDKSNTIKRLDDGVCSTLPILDSLNRVQNANFVNEDGLYDVILDSRKPSARKFRKWITSEVLPSIRKTGSYAPRTYREALVMALEAEDRRIEAEKQRIEAEQKAAMLTEKIVEFAPKVDNYNQFLSIDDSITVSCVAKKFGLSATKLNRILKDQGVQYKPKGRSFWLPKQGYEDWFMVKDVKYDGDTRLTNQTRVSPLGEEKIKEILVRLGYHEQMLLPF